MKILIDTHILIWLVSDSTLLSKDAREILTNKDNEVYYSVISIWEIAIKRKLHPEEFNFSPQDIIFYAEKSNSKFLSLLNQHILPWKKLTMLPGEAEHKDPFDRILVCQAIAENMKFMTHDSKIPLFDVDCIIEV